MNFDIGGPSVHSSSSSSSDNDEILELSTQTTKQILSANTLMALHCQNQLHHQTPRHGGSIPGHIVLQRDREVAHQNLFNDYFSDNPRYGEDLFRRRFRMSRSLFLRIVDAVKSHNPFFEQKTDALGRLGLSTLQKITAAFRMLAYGVPADATNEYIKIGESTAIESIKKFCRTVVEIFSQQYLRRPNSTDIARLLYIGEERGFPGMLGSLDCIHCQNQLHHQTPRHGGSIPGHIVLQRDREVAHQNLFNDYFSDNPRYDEDLFRRRFRMSRSLFLRIVDVVKSHNPYFEQKTDALGRLGLLTLQKITATFRMLAYGVPADATDEYIKIGESTTIESIKKFCRTVVEIFSQQYLRRPNSTDIARLLYIGEERGFPGMFGSLDCMHWKWKNCPTAWVGQYSGRSGSPTIILEAIADYDLWIWHAYFGMPGTNNDINVLESSHLISDLAQGIAPPAHYVIEGENYDMGYYLADNIYPKWSNIVQTIHEPRGTKKKYFAMKQESCRKDVERAFGVLLSRFAIVAGPARFWRKENLHDIMTTCIILHNMIVEDERDLNATIVEAVEAPIASVEREVDDNTRFEQFLARHKRIKDKDAHIALRNALIEHLWKKYSNLNN